jgi:membrane protease YdiL (CAAX protease family)
MHSFNKSVWTNPLPMIELILAGVLLALVREVTGGLWAPIGFHFTWNFFQGPIFGFEVSGLPMSSLIQTEATGNSLISGGQFGAEGSIISILITSLAIIFVYVVGKNRYKNSH